MSVPPMASSTPCYYNFDPDRTCGKIMKYSSNESSEESSIHLSSLPSLSDLMKGNEQKEIQGNDSIGFGDILDIINPLQHLPLVGWAYRHVTGDTIKPVSAMVGGAIFGGGIGLLSSAVQQALINHQEESEGKTTLAMGQDHAKSQADEVMVVSSPVIHKDDIVWDHPALSSLRYEKFSSHETVGSIAVYG